MLNSLLMLGSTNNKLKKGKYIFLIIWIGYLLINANLKSGLLFTIVNLITFLGVFTLGNIIKEKHTNNVISILSILIWSVIIDMISYYMYPTYSMGQSIFGYVGNGILFNFKYVFINCIAVILLNTIDYAYKTIKVNNKKTIITN